MDPVFCPDCDTRRFTLDTPCLSCTRHKQARHNPSLPLERFRCSKCRCFRPITDYPLQDDNFRASTCSICHAHRRDEYLEQKGEPVSQARRARQLIKARQVIKKALRVRIQGEKRKKWWLEARKRWEQGDRGFVQRDIRSFQKGPEYCEGPYRQWVGYIDPREEGWREESWEGLADSL